MLLCINLEWSFLCDGNHAHHAKCVRLPSVIHHYEQVPTQKHSYPATTC